MDYNIKIIDYIYILLI